MKVLILGGTIFLGRHLTEIALARGHEVTFFNRGQHNADLFPGVEKLRGDRDGELGALRGRRWDVVIDTCGYVPRIVSASAELLADAVDLYVFISSLSVYRDASEFGINESSPLGQLEDETVEEVNGESYGPLKALCEQAAEAALPGRVLNVRPGLIVGPHDPSDRFTYWPARIAKGGEVLAPRKPGAPVQIIDVRDLSEWIIRAVESRQVGFFNVTGPGYSLAMEGMLETCLASVGSDATLTWVDEKFLLEAGAGPWVELPLRLPGDEDAGLMAVSIAKAQSTGLVFRALAETVRDTLAWANTRSADHEWRAGLNHEREQELLSAWHQRGRR